MYWNFYSRDKSNKNRELDYFYLRFKLQRWKTDLSDNSKCETPKGSQCLYNWRELKVRPKEATLKEGAVEDM